MSDQFYRGLRPPERIAFGEEVGGSEHREDRRGAVSTSDKAARGVSRILALLEKWEKEDENYEGVGDDFWVALEERMMRERKGRRTAPPAEGRGSEGE